MSARRMVCLLLMVCVAPVLALAGGPLVVGGPAVGNRAAFGRDGQPFTWNPAAMPIRYRVDTGPLSATSTGTAVVSNSTGLSRLQAMFGVWQGVPTAAISFSNAGPLLPAGSYTGGDLATVQQFNDIQGSCNRGEQSPVVFDADATIMADLGVPPEVIGFAGACVLDGATGYIVSAGVIMNGKFQDGVSTLQASPPNYEFTANEFDEAFAHEIGHFIGLDHSQINLDMLTSYKFPCEVDGLAGLPLMFPELLCQARKDAGLPTLSPDDVAWISTLYPGAAFATSHGTISGTIYFPDGVSQVQGANVIARLVDDPNTPQDESRRVTVSVISGYLFTGNPGQPLTGDNTNGSRFGSRNPQRIGYYEMAVPPGTYTVEVESVYSAFQSDSGMGPLDPPVPIPGDAEFWNQDESSFDFLLQRDTVTVHAGENVTGIDIILNRPYSRFDQYEDSGAVFDSPLPIVLGIGAEVRA